ncbi:hypothetical protein [Cystobacter fuscus]
MPEPVAGTPEHEGLNHKPRKQEESKNSMGGLIDFDNPSTPGRSLD